MVTVLAKFHRRFAVRGVGIGVYTDIANNWGLYHTPTYPCMAIAAQCRRLSPYLNERIDYLKLDIEGSEDVVLAEAEPCLGSVRHLFCEYHGGLGMPAGRLAGILGVLERSGFDVHIGKSYGFQYWTTRQPMRHVTDARPFSAVIWARNRKGTSA